MRHEQDEFADFYRASRDSCLRAVTAVVGDRELAQEQVAEAFTGVDVQPWSPSAPSAVPPRARRSVSARSCGHRRCLTERT